MLASVDVADPRTASRWERMSRLLISGCDAVVTMDDAGTELSSGSILVDDGVIAWVGVGGPPASLVADADVLDGRGCVAIPGLVNTHHHLYQVLTRARAQQDNLFGWLTELYPVWAGLDAEWVRAAAAAGLAELALSGCSTSTDHHYVFPAGAGDLLEAEIAAARAVGVRFHPCRGSMDLGVSNGGLPPDTVVQDTDAILAATERAVARFHDPWPGAMVRIAIAPCSPFSASERLMRESAALARRLGVRLHTHIAETADEDAFCRERFGCSPVELLERLGFLGDDTWLAHAVRLSAEDVRRIATSGTGVAHCPTSNLRLGSGSAPIRELVDAGVPVGIGVDGSASNDGGHMLGEVRQALLVARGRGGPGAMTAREALRLGTRGGAACLGRDDVGSIAPGKRADIALFDVTGLATAGTEADPVAGIVLAWPQRVRHLLVEGRFVVRDGALVTVDEAALAAEAHRAARRIAVQSD
jgi:cytosine/adenosine deaminase-related metal-dependent hydrolase